jgi:Zn-dependent protease with chaperone function
MGVLAVALLGGFYVCGFGLVAVVGGLSVWFWLAFPGQLAHELSGAAAALTVGLAVATWQVMRARPVPPDGVPVDERQAPELWACVRSLAGSMGTHPPAEIRLGWAANAMVYEDARLLGLRPGRRYLYLGVPLLAALTVEQVRFVLAHELAHYARQHTRWGLVTYRGGRVIVETIAGAGRGSVAGAALSAYAGLYFLVSLAVIRRMELEADRAAVRVAGREVGERTLRATPGLVKAWETGVAGYARWNRRIGYSPAELLHLYAWTVEHRPPEHAWTMRVPASPWDSHPPIAQRIAMIVGEPPAVVPADERPGTALVADRERIGDALRSAEFDEWATRLAQDEARSDARRLHRAAAGLLGGSGRRLGDVLDLLAAGRHGELAGALAAPVEHAGWGEALTDIVYAAVAAEVVAAGAARWHHSWSWPLTLVGPDGPVDLWPAVGLACRDATGVAALHALLLDLGVDEAGLAGWAVPGRSALDPGAPDGGLLLPDKVLLLIRATRPRRRPDGDVVQAALAAAVVAELRSRGRVRLADTPDATVTVCDPAPTGDVFLDGVLTRLADGRPRPAYRWLQALGPDVEQAVSSRLHAPLRYQDGGFVRTNDEIPEADLIVQARSAIVAAVDHNDLDSAGFLLGALLWAVEITPTVLGRTSPVTRYGLGRLAARDRLAMAVRTVIGQYMHTPTR